MEECPLIENERTFDGGIQMHHFPLEDHPKSQEKMQKIVLPQTLELIEQSLQKKETIFVHCGEGKNRAGKKIFSLFSILIFILFHQLRLELVI